MAKLKTNESIAEHLRAIARIYEVRKETQRSIAFNRAADAVDDHDEDVTTMPNVTDLANVGPSTAAVINEFIKTGSSQRFKDLGASTPQVEIKLDLEAFAEAGVNALMALGLWNKHKIGNPEQLKKALDDGTVTDAKIIAAFKYKEA